MIEPCRQDQSSVANESGSEDSEAEGFIQNELSDIPLGELQALREKIGTKKFDIVLQKSREEKEKRSFKRVNKNRPSEVSSKRPVSRYREVIHVPKAESSVTDPRFNDRAGNLNLDLFKKTYSFVEDIKKKEKEKITKEAKRVKNPERKGQLKKLLQKMESRELAEQKQKEKDDLMREHKKSERERMKSGKKAFHIKKSTQKKLLLAKKYTELKKSGKLDKFIAKKRKKNASRDRKQLPFKRTV
ncbi:ribosomal RNA processing protein 36 homolog isoform X2 [Halichondria panicea]|uniref:ribosomal RNA processing protein 36 homolog isoform X2 n=1 Tax=Halichondria panicea TaxID=6063 RepID=UPI00312BB8BB